PAQEGRKCLGELLEPGDDVGHGVPLVGGMRPHSRRCRGFGSARCHRVAWAPHAPAVTRVMAMTAPCQPARGIPEGGMLQVPWWGMDEAVPPRCGRRA